MVCAALRSNRRRLAGLARRVPDLLRAIVAGGSWVLGAQPGGVAFDAIPQAGCAPCLSPPNVSAKLCDGQRLRRGGCKLFSQQIQLRPALGPRPADAGVAV